MNKELSEVNVVFLITNNLIEILGGFEMKKLFCDLCGAEAKTLHEITVIFDVKGNVNGDYTCKEDKKEVCTDCEFKFKIESHKALERVYKRLKKVK